MKITGDWIKTAGTQAVCVMLEEAGYQAFFVGGCVRDALLHRPVKDIDIATDALPERVMELAEGKGLNAIPTGIDHGTVTVVSDHIPHEITTFREDVETTGRHATVRFSGDITQDARRRDFTMNALYADRQGTVTDPLGSLPDLQAQRVRFIENPIQRIREDYLRSLRFFRFHAWYGDADAGMDPDALDAIARETDGLSRLSRERVGTETLRLLAAPDPAPSVCAMAHTGALAVVLPGAVTDGLAPLVHIEGDLDLVPDPIRRLAVLGGEGVPERLRLSKAQARYYTQLREEMGAATEAIELGYRLGEAEASSVLALRAASMGSPITPGDPERAKQGAKAEFPVSPADLMPAFAGPALGAKLRQLETQWLASDCVLGRDALLGESS
jgi:poly(A) polymerase